MKRHLYIIVAILAGAFVSCQKNDLTNEAVTECAQRVTLNLVADDALGTRAAGVSNYLIEVYSDATYTTPANIFGAGNDATNRSVSTNGSFSMILDRTKDYYCLFWADKDATAYTTTQLKSVTLKSGKTPAEAWFGTATISGKNATQTVTLKRAVAKLNLLEIGALLSGTTLTTTFDQPTVFNVSNGEIVRGDADANIVSRTETITLTDAVNGTKENPVTLNSTDYFVLTPVATQYVAAVTFQCGEEEQFEVSNVPFQANYKTNIKGHYTSLASETFTVTCDDAWETTDKDVDIDEVLYSIGDYYPDPANSATAVGVVFWLDATDAKYVAKSGTTPARGSKGKIVSLDQGADVAWELNNTVTNANSDIDGAANMTKIKAIPNWATNAPAFAWCDAKNTPAVASVSWYLPAKKELRQLYAGWCGLIWIASSSTAKTGEIADWGDQSDMTNYSNYADARTTFNSILTTTSGGVGLVTDEYWSSTEYNNSNAWSGSFWGGATNFHLKYYILWVRAISAF